MVDRRRLTVYLALVLATGVAGDIVMANCQNEGPYEVRQCANGSWFAVPPAGSGPVAITWWAVGFGNKTVNTPPGSGIVDPGGSGFLPTPLPGQFIGIDSGLLSLQGLDVVDGSTIAGLGAPVGSFCLSSAANWGAPGTDSCSDINRTSAGGGGANSVSDNFINRYWGDGSSIGYLYLYNQLDPPMGVLMTEGTNRWFALAFFATTPKTPPIENDLDPGQYNMAALVNGDVNPFGPVIVPWQAVPQPSVSQSFTVPNDPYSPRTILMGWNQLRFIHDGSTRPCREADGTTPCASVLGGGVGVLDQGPLIRYVMETTPLSGSGTCGSNWTEVPGSAVDYPATSTTGTIVPDACVRLVVNFGRAPVSTMRTNATTADRDANRLDAQTGRLGDIGYRVVSAVHKLGGALVSQKATLKLAEKDRGTNLHLVFDTDTELNITGFDVVGIDNKGGRKVVGTVACKQCTNGLSASYDEILSGAKLQGAKKVQIVIQPAGTQSNTLDVK